MQTITSQKQLQKELAFLQSLAKQHKGQNTPEIVNALTKAGYMFTPLGTSSAQYTWSGNVKIHSVSERNTWIKYGAGRYLVCGAANTIRGGYPVYRGYAKKIDFEAK